MPTTLVKAEALVDELVHKQNVRSMTRAIMEAQWGIPTGMQADGFSPFQIDLLATVFTKFLTDKESDIKDAVVAIDLKLQYVCYPGTFQGRLCQVYWDGPELMLSPMPVH